MTNNPDDIIARASEVLDRHRIGERVSRGVKNGVKRARRGAITGMVVLILAFIYGGFVAPLGITGVLAVALLFMMATAAAILWPTGSVRIPDISALPKTPIAQLPARTGNWLESQRLALPAPARTLADGIGVKLANLEAQLQSLPEDTPAAASVRRLLAEELPELVQGYGRVPKNLRHKGIDGHTPDAQLVDGLTVVASELTRMSEQLARGDLEKLATQGKYLELKYQGDPLA